jgi:hypothetical protein
MSEQVGPIEVCCDAPLYRVVQASRGLGIRLPEDVRWLRMSTFRCQLVTPRGVASYFRELFGSRDERPRTTCTCGDPLPGLDRLLIAYDGATETAYHIGQCSRCRTVFWDAAQRG